MFMAAIQYTTKKEVLPTVGLMSRYRALWQYFLFRAVLLKAIIVQQDPEERKGIRSVLNFGHTIGHGIEGVLGIPHGYAVAAGMALE